MEEGKVAFIHSLTHPSIHPFNSVVHSAISPLTNAYQFNLFLNINWSEFVSSALPHICIHILFVFDNNFVWLNTSF